MYEVNSIRVNIARAKLEWRQSTPRQLGLVVYSLQGRLIVQ